MFIASEFQENSLMLYKGIFTVNLVSILGNHLRMVLNHDYKGVQKIFKIFIELTQNVSYYSAENREMSPGVICGAGWVSVQEYPDEYRVSTGNRIKPQDGPTLERYCREINERTGEDLRKLKREIRSQAMERDTGAHIGLIQISISSGNQLDFSVTSLPDDFLYFILTTHITKESE